MSYQVSYTEPITGISTLTDAQNAIDALEQHHDPANDKVVNHANISFAEDEDGNVVYDLQFAIHHRNVTKSGLAAEIDNVATVVGNLPVGPDATTAADNARPQNNP